MGRATRSYISRDIEVSAGVHKQEARVLFFYSFSFELNEVY